MAASCPLSHSGTCLVKGNLLRAMRLADISGDVGKLWVEQVTIDVSSRRRLTGGKRLNRPRKQSFLLGTTVIGYRVVAFSS